MAEQKHPANVILIKSEDEYNKTIEANKVVLADFNASWCPPCRKLKPALHQIAEKNPDIIILDIDVDQNRELSMKFKVQSIPYMILYQDGKKFKDTTGFDVKFLKEQLPAVMPTIKLDAVKFD